MSTSRGFGQFTQVVDNLITFYLRPPRGRPIVIFYEAEKAQLAHALRLGLAMRGNPVTELAAPADADDARRALTEVCANPDAGLLLLTSPRLAQALALQPWGGPTDRLSGAHCRCAPVFHDDALPPDVLLRLYSADPPAISAYLDGIRRQLPERVPLRLTAPGGTDLTLTPRDWEVRHWAVAAAPEELTAEGTLVVDGAVFFAPVRTPIILTLEQGRLVELTCDDPLDVVFRRYSRRMEAARDRRLATWTLTEVGFGGNPQATFGNAPAEVRAVRDAAYFAFGDTIDLEAGSDGGWYGGTVVVRDPVVTVK